MNRGEAFGRSAADCGPGSVVVKPPGESHANRYGEAGAHCLVLEVTPGRLAAARPFADLFDRPAYLPPGQLTALFLRIYEEFRQPDRASPLVLEGLVLELIGTAARRGPPRGPSAPPPWLRRVEGLLRDAPAEARTLTALAAAAGCHPSHLAREFRRFYRCSMGGYLRRLRLDAAARVLSGTERPLAEVAAGAGFYDQSHFTRAFKARFRMTPGAFRAATRGGDGLPRLG